MASKPNTEEAPWHAGWQSAKALFFPGLLLQVSALALVLGYYYLPAAQGWFAALARWRVEGGYVFSALMSSVCGGLLPFLYLRFTSPHRASYPWPHLAFFTLYWAWKGAEVDLLYRGLGMLYGTQATVGVILCKVVTDQFLFNPLYAAPVGNLLFAWKDAGFRPGPVLADLKAGRWYARSVLPVLISVWALWIPVVSCIYAMPSALQVPLFNVVLCFWSLLFAHVTARQNRES